MSRASERGSISKGELKLYFWEAKEHYLQHLRSGDKSDNTIRSAQQALNLIDAYLQLNDIESASVGALVPADLTVILSADHGMAPATYNRYRSVFVSFYDYCAMRRWSSPMNPAKQLPTRKVIEQPNLILTPDQMLGMLDNANPVERIALALGMNTALRAGDVSALRVGDVDLNSLTLRTKIQKTGGYDEKPITNGLAVELDRWLDAYEASQRKGSEASWHLVPSYVLQPSGFTRDTQLVTFPERPMTHLHRIVQRALERQGLPTLGEGFHTLRRSASRALFEKLRTEGNYDHALLVVKEFLNHKSVEQTQRYLGINHERQIRDDLLRGKDFLVKSPADPWEPTACTAGVVDGINQRHGLAYDNPERIY